MKLIIREYLSLLKESKELDLLLPDLLLSMGIEPISRAQVGVRQYGVDVAAVGAYAEGEKSLYLFTIKPGDLGRKDWATNEQSVRQSLEEIKDVYLETYVRPEYSQLPKKIILCTGGDLKQESELTWKSYVSKNRIEGEVEYDFWGGDRLSLLIEEYMFNEQLLPAQFRSHFRKVLALLPDPDYGLSDYYHILDDTLLYNDFGDLTKQSGLKKAKKALRTIHLCLNVIYFWAKQENNLKPALISAERTVLITWEFLRRNNLISKRSLRAIYHEIYRTSVIVYAEYFKKVQSHCYVKNGLHRQSAHFILGNLNLFECMGIISITGIMHKFQADIENDEQLLKSARAISDTLKALIVSHPSTVSPLYDSHIIELSAAIYLLVSFSELEFLEPWIHDIVDHIAYAYRSMGMYFPIQSDSFDDLVALNVSNAIDRSKLVEMSTLFPILAQWCAVLNFDDTYQFIRRVVMDVFPRTVLQIWYPDKSTDQYLYTCNAANNKSGAVDAPIVLPESIDKMKNMIQEVQAKTVKFEDLTSTKYGFPILPIISSRHYRTPFLPLYWQVTPELNELIGIKKANNEN